MKSPFVRFSRFVRRSLPMATVGLCLLSSCRHVPGLRHASEDRLEGTPTVSSDDDIRGVPGYEESSLAEPISPDATDRPLVSLSESAGDAFRLVPPDSPDVTLPKPEVASPPVPPPPAVASNEPTPAAEPLFRETTPKSAEVSQPTVEVSPPKRELSATESDQPQLKKPAPTLDELEDEFFSEQKESTSELKVPPEPKAETPPPPAAEPPVELKVGAQPLVAAKEVASVESGKVDVPFKAVPRKSPARPTEAVPVVDHEVLSLDSYCDGLVFDSQGFGYVSHKDRIVRFSPTGETSVWTTLSSPKGHRIEPEGTHLVCDTERRAVLRMSFDGKLIGVAAKECDGAALRAPYDIAVDPKGGFYFSDPGYVQIKNPIGKLHYVDRSGKVSVVVAKIGYPTGIVFDAARQRLLVAESMLNRIVEFRLSEPGRIESHEVLVQLPKSPDSEYHLANLCLDADGNLYVTQQQTKAVHVFDPQGRPLGRFSTGTVAPSSVALRSPDAAELFLTGEAESRTRNGKVIRLDLGK